MGAVLDAILKRVLVRGPLTVNTDFISPVLDLDGRENEFSLQLVYENGNSVDIDLSIEVSSDGVNFVQLADSFQNISDDSGTHIWDIAGTGTSYLRVAMTVNSGSIDIVNLISVMKRRH
jgi:hypothetical protein